MWKGFTCFKRFLFLKMFLWTCEMKTWQSAIFPLPKERVFCSKLEMVKKFKFVSEMCYPSNYPSGNADWSFDNPAGFFTANCTENFQIWKLNKSSRFPKDISTQKVLLDWYIAELTTLMKKSFAKIILICRSKSENDSKIFMLRKISFHRKLFWTHQMQFWQLNWKI